MRIPPCHRWDLNISQARELQVQLSRRIIRHHSGEDIDMIAGIDISVSRFSGTGRAAIVILNYPDLEIREISVAEGDIDFPYIPGLLSFREAPLVLLAWKRLKTRPDLLMVDGQGIAHPRRLGIASHLGLLLNTPSIGCAKSRLIGTHDVLPQRAGSFRLLSDNGEVIGAAVRTKRAVKPLYISIGHRVELDKAISLVLDCCRGFRLPQPTRLAHIAAGGSSDLKVHAFTRQKILQRR